MSQDTHDKDQIIQYRDLNEITYSLPVIQFLRNKLDDFTINCFREIVRHHNKGGLTKTSLNVYQNQRKKYEAAFLILESQGFIEVRSDGAKKPYFLSKRGLQLVTFLQDEAKRNSNNQL